MIPIQVMFDAVTKILMEYGPNTYFFPTYPDQLITVYSERNMNSEIGYIDENGFSST